MSSRRGWKCWATVFWRPRRRISVSGYRTKSCSAIDLPLKDEKMTRLIQDPLSPLEQFVRDYVEARAGAWDEIEPRVYDLLIGPEIIQVAFDPEALPEHPSAQLASLG